MNFIVIPSDGPIHSIEAGEDKSYEALSGAVGGYIEALPFERHDRRATAYINEEGKFDPACEPNPRASALVELFPGDYIAGPLVIAGLNHNTGATESCPLTLDDVNALIERYA